ncbi:MAG: tetratricopeptide repeat protein, partial [Crocosphaera sp.]
RQGDCFRHQGQLEEALKNYEKALSVKPNDYWSWYQKGQIWQQLNLCEAAINCYQKALEAEPNDEYAWYYQGHCQAVLKNKDQAINCLLEAIDISPDIMLELAKNNHAFDSYWQDSPLADFSD